MSKTLFVIALESDEGKADVYLYSDPDAGLLMGTEHLQNAKFFDSRERVYQEHASLLAQPNSGPYTNGWIYPPDFISRGFGLSNKKPMASGRLCIKEIKIDSVLCTAVKGEIKKPTGYTYD